MHVPYSMDDSEPDLGGCMPGGSHRDHDTSRDTSWHDYETVQAPPKPEFVFMTEMDLVRSEVFMKHIRMALKGKDRQIHEMRVENLMLAERLGWKQIGK